MGSRTALRHARTSEVARSRHGVRSSGLRNTKRAIPDARLVPNPDALLVDPDDVMGGRYRAVGDQEEVLVREQR